MVYGMHLHAKYLLFHLFQHLRVLGYQINGPGDEDRGGVLEMPVET